MAAVDSRTEWEKQQEMEEFSRAASLYHKPMSGLMASRFVRAKHTDDADDTHEVPAETEVRRLVCVQYNIFYPGKPLQHQCGSL